MKNHINKSIENLRKYEPSEGYYLAFSGGKDSIVVKQLAIDAKVKFDANYSVTTIDPPELIKFIRTYHKDVKWQRPNRPFFQEMIKRGFPCRPNRRWCCSVYKEGGGENRVVLTGVRWEESLSRRNWNVVVKQSKKTLINPIIEWSSEEIWDFIRSRKIPYCELYDLGWYRLGCVLCPFASQKNRLREAIRYPGYVKAWKWAFNKLYEKKKIEGKKSILKWKNGDEMFNWWLTGKMNNENQQSLFAQG